MTRKRRSNWGFEHSNRTRSEGYLTQWEADFIAKQRGLHASDQAIADMIGRPVSDLSLNVVVQGNAVTPAAAATDAERRRRNELNRQHRTTVWRPSK